MTEPEVVEIDQGRLGRALFKGAPFGDRGVKLQVEEDTLLKFKAPVKQRRLGRWHPALWLAMCKDRRDEGGVFSPSRLLNDVVLEFKAFPRK